MKRLLVTTVTAAVIVAVSSSSLRPAVQAADEPTGPAQLVASSVDPLGLRGDDAVAALEDADAVDVVAATAGLEPDELVEELVDDPSMFVTADGMVGYEDLLPVGPATEGSALEASALVPADVFDLNSLPSSPRVIYLDFDGHTTSGDFWNDGAAFTSAAALSSPPTDVQRAAVYEIWQRVAEDYLPFGINVTTKDPGVEGLRRTSPADGSYGQRMVITPSNFVNSSTVGIALLNVFAASFDHSAFVFTSANFWLSSSSIKKFAEAVSHEAGHTLGLKHDGVRTSEYYDGHGQWAPIMGRSISTSTPVTQWSKGEYSCASNWQDDITQIAAYGGFVPDDHPGSTVGASAIAPNGEAANGVLGAQDVDVFVTNVAAGPLAVSLSPTATGSNLHAGVTVRSSAGVVVGTASPATASSWQAVVSLPNVPADLYSIEVRSAGYLDADVGFTAYGSTGAYAVDVKTSGGISASPAAPATSPAPVPGTACVSPIAPTRLLDTRVGFGGSTRIPAGGQITLQVTGGAIPSGATAAVLNIVSVGASGAGYITAHPCLAVRPTTSILNYGAGQIVANNTIAPLSSAGRICLFALSETDVVVDATAWIGPGGTSRLTQVGPDRVADTRIGLGGTRLPAGGTMALSFANMPGGTTAVALNLAAVNPSGGGFLTAYPCGTERPGTASSNYVAGINRANNAIVGLGGGQVCIYSQSETDVVVDVTALLGPSGDLKYQATSPTRVLDTRTPSGAVVPAATQIDYLPLSAALSTSQPGAAFVNVTSVDHPSPGFVQTYDCVSRGTTATLNQEVGLATGNGAIVPLGPGNASCAWTNAGGNVVVDLYGWWVR